MKFAALLIALSLHAQVPEIAFDSTPNFLKLPEHVYLGEVAGVATNSKGNIFVYTRTGGVATTGGSRWFTHGGSRLFEFDASGKYVREVGQGVYAFLFAQSVKIDPQDNIWVVDRGSNMVLKLDPAGRIAMTTSRKPEAVNLVSTSTSTPVRAVAGDNFNKPTDVAWDATGNVYVADGYGNSRIVKLDKNGKYLKSWGTKGTGPGQFNTPHSIALDAQGNVYVADRGNNRIQVFDNEGTFKTQFTNIGAPAAICISPGSHQFLFSSNSNPTGTLDNGEIYKMELDGKVIGKFGQAGKLPKEFGETNQIDCRNPNAVLVGELSNWRVQKLTLH